VIHSGGPCSWETARQNSTATGKQIEVAMIVHLLKINEKCVAKGFSEKENLT
jgi:hypothetical protein